MRPAVRAWMALAMASLGYTPIITPQVYMPESSKPAAETSGSASRS